jgi:ABC-type antimicrobial peptide transport system permease subunit
MLADLFAFRQLRKSPGFTFVALLTLLLAAVGIYGVISYSVTQRRREVGIRLALGAQRGDVLRLVVRQGMQPVLTGLAVGLFAAALLSRFISSLLFQVSVIDPAVYAAVAMLLGLVALAASLIPAQHATRIDPLEALRYECESQISNQQSAISNP